MYKITLTFITAAMLAACTQTSTPDKTQPPQTTVCSQDAKQCSDGSWVGRSGPNCEFACPSATPN
jgi:uncharacterized lipoprotein YajG